MSKSFQIAKKAAVRMANTSVAAVDTHHTQWACMPPKGPVIRPK
ncbi:hypothetical protein [Glaciecola sp. MH2013]|nr:hypothetical protein [Glaciecola sp. MH2013]